MQIAMAAPYAALCRPLGEHRREVRQTAFDRCLPGRNPLFRQSGAACGGEIAARHFDQRCRIGAGDRREAVVHGGDHVGEIVEQFG